MAASGPELQLAIVPGSGTGELAGIAGTAAIAIDAQGGHALRLDYDLE